MVLPLRAYLVEVLRDLNYRVLSAHDAVSALGLIKEGDIRIDLPPTVGSWRSKHKIGDPVSKFCSRRVIPETPSSTKVGSMLALR